jgi:type III pantothenate kinase
MNTNLLLIDAGNTRVKWALAAPGAAPGQWIAGGAVTHAELARLPALWAAHGFGRAVVANVAGPALRAALEGLLAPAAIDWFTAPPALNGLRNGYREPGRLGCDRFAAALGARTLAPDTPLIVATCGTATTIDAVGLEGAGAVFLGGMILPGLNLMSAALANNTAQLPPIDSSRRLTTSFADNTADAILAGCLAAQAGAIERALAQHGGASLLLSGGAAHLVAPVLAVPYRLVDNIVLIGLHASVQGSVQEPTRGMPPC